MSQVKVGREIYGYDFPYLHVLDLKSYYPNVWEEEDFRNPHHHIRIARVPLHPVGYAVFQHSDRVMRVLRLAVGEGWRRQGIGSRLMRYVFDEARDMGIFKITVVVRETNDVAISFLRHHYFRAVGVVGGQDEDCYLFKRKL